MFVDEGIRMSKIHHPNILTPIGITFDICQGDQQCAENNAKENKSDDESLDENNNDKSYSLYTISEDNTDNNSQVTKPKPVKIGNKNDKILARKPVKKLLSQPSIVLPIMINGDLCRYLRSQRLFPIQSLVNFSKQIAEGMYFSVNSFPIILILWNFYTTFVLFPLWAN